MTLLRHHLYFVRVYLTYRHSILECSLELISLIRRYLAIENMRIRHLIFSLPIITLRRQKQALPRLKRALVVIFLLYLRSSYSIDLSRQRFLTFATFCLGSDLCHRNRLLLSLSIDLFKHTHIEP